MKKILLMMTVLGLSTSLGNAVAASPVTTVSYTTMLPLGTALEFLSESGAVIGQANGAGLVQFKDSYRLSDVAAVQVVNGSDRSGMLYYFDKRDAPVIQWFGPSGQMMTLNLPLLSRIQWLSPTTGRLSVFHLSSE